VHCFEQATTSSSNTLHTHSMEMELKRERESKLVTLEENQLLKTKIGHLESDLLDSKKRMEAMSKNKFSEVYIHIYI
jgi:hypothetical protein